MSTNPNVSNLRHEILGVSVSLFAEAGYSGVSMRDIAKSVGVTPAALYYHFPDKQTLYIETVRFAMDRNQKQIDQALMPDGTPEERFMRFIQGYILLIHDDPDFRRLVQREIMDTNEERQELLFQSALKKEYTTLLDIVSKIAPSVNAHISAVTVITSVLYHFEMAPIKRLDAAETEETVPNMIAEHLGNILLYGLKGNKISTHNQD
jgi:TetR/AcrR family transcriptional regulator